MKIKVLGSGTSIPHPRRCSPGFWLETSNANILLDSGPDIPHRMAQEQLEWSNLDVIWVSHFHMDHFGGLVPFLFSLRWAVETQTRTKTLRICGPNGLRNLLNSFNDANNYRLFNQPFPIEIVEIPAEAHFSIAPGLTAKTLKTPHTNESLALYLTDTSDKKFVYTSDTGFTEELVQFSNEADLLMMECSFRRNKPLQKHLELSEAMDLAERCAPKRVALTHLYPEWDELDVVAEAKSFWHGDVVEATDGLVLEI